MNFLLIAEAGGAAADAANEAANSVMGGMSWFTILWLVAIVAFFYFFMIRPQKKEQKKMSAMLAELATGDVVLTTSGFYGVIIDIQEDTVIVEFGNNKNCRIPMQKQAIVQVEKAKQA